MSDQQDPFGAEESETSPRPPRWVPWGIGMVLAPLVAAGLLTAYRIWSEKQADEGIASVRLADGSRVVVDHVSVGRVHNYTLKAGNAVRLPFIGQLGSNPETTTLTTNADRIVIFFRHVEPDGAPSDLAWWHAFSAMADDEEDLWDDEGSRVYLSQGGGISSVHGTLGSNTPPTKLERSVGAVELPMSAFGGPYVSLRLLDAAGNAKAALSVPVSVPVPTWWWTAEDLPARREMEGVEVILKKVSLRALTSTVRDQPRVHYVLDREWEILENGQPTRAWKIDGESARDEFGESGLPPKAWKAPVWRLSALLTPVTPSFEMPDANSSSVLKNALTIPDLPIPTRDTNVELDRSFVVMMPEQNPVPITVDRVGTGQSSWSGTGMRPRSHQSGLGTSDGIGQFGFGGSYSSDTGWTQRVEGAGSWIRLVHNRLQGGERLEFDVTDDQGRHLQLFKYTPGRDVTWLHVRPLPDSRSMTIQVFPLRTFALEFHITPPDRPDIRRAR